MKGGFSTFCILDLSLGRSLAIAVHPSRYSIKNVSGGRSQMKLGGCLTLYLWLFSLYIRFQSLYNDLCCPDTNPLPFSSLFLLFLQLDTKFLPDWIRYCDNYVCWELHWHCMCPFIALSVLLMVSFAGGKPFLYVIDLVAEQQC